MFSLQDEVLRSCSVTNNTIGGMTSVNTNNIGAGGIRSAQFGGNSQILNDIVNSDEFINIINTFTSVTNTNFTLADVAEYIVMFQKSTILLNIMNTFGAESPALTCLRAFIQSKEPLIDRMFIPRFIALCNVKISLTSSRYTSVNSIVANVTCQRTVPSKQLSVSSAKTMVEALKRDMRNMETYTVVQNPLRVPVKIKFNQELMDQLVNADVDFSRAIEEGNRRHNIEITSYNKRKTTVD